MTDRNAAVALRVLAPFATAGVNPVSGDDLANMDTSILPNHAMTWAGNKLFQLDRSLSGAPAAGEIAPNSGVGLWSPLSASVSAFDHVVESVADLPAAVAGVRTLTSGSWAFVEAVDIGTDILRVPSGTTVLLKGMGGFSQKMLSGSGGAVLDIQGSAYIETLSVNATAGVALAMSSNASVKSLMCAFFGDLEAVSLGGVAVSWRDISSHVSGGTDGFVMTGGLAYLEQTRILAGTDNAVSASGADVAALWMHGCQLSANAADTLEWSCSAGELITEDTEILNSGAGFDCVSYLLGLTGQFVGGRWQASGTGAGLRIGGNITRILQLANVAGYAMASFVEYAAGTVRQATIQGCATFSNVGVGVTWAAASIPTNGLALVGNTFDTATPLSGFASTDARVNSKANIQAGALMSETAIVP